MMHDDDEIPADLRDLFAAERGRSDGPPAGAKERVASALSITLGIGIGAAATAATSAAGATMGAGATAGAAMGAGSGAATMAGTSGAAATTTAAAATTTAAAVAAGTGATTAAGAGFTATGGALAKGLAFVFATAVAGTTGTGIYLAAKDETKPATVEVAPSADVPSTFDPTMLGKKAPPPLVEKPKPKAPVAPMASAPIASAPVVEIERAPPAPVESTPEAKAERLRGERAILDTARSAVARGDGGAALIALEAHRANYAEGALVEERDALTILALAKVGRTDEARKKADAFRARNPHSLFLKAIDGALR